MLIEVGNFPKTWDFGVKIGKKIIAIGNSQNALKSGNLESEVKVKKLVLKYGLYTVFSKKKRWRNIILLAALS